MKRILFLFVDGVGLGRDDSAVNPFSVAELPTLRRFTHGMSWFDTTPTVLTDESAFVPTDPRLGVPGRPQSGSSQAAILTGQNVPEIIGEHYGPKPNEPIRNLLTDDNLFMRIRRAGMRTALLDAYPERLLQNIRRGKTLPSSIQFAAIASGQDLFTADDLRAGRALTAEWTGEEWRSHLKYSDTPIYTPFEAGQRLVAMSREYAFAFHSHWITDYIGHRGTVEEGATMLTRLDGVIAGICSVWQPNDGLVILTSDHGNMEHIGDRRHTENDVPTLILGRDAASFANGLRTLTDFAPRIEAYLGIQKA